MKLIILKWPDRQPLWAACGCAIGKASLEIVENWARRFEIHKRWCPTKGGTICGNRFNLRHGYVCQEKPDHTYAHRCECPNAQFHQSWDKEHGTVALGWHRLEAYRQWLIKEHPCGMCHNKDCMQCNPWWHFAK